MDQEQTPNPAPDTDTLEEGSLDAAALAFDKRAQPADGESEATDHAPGDESTTDDPNAEAVEGQTDADTAEIALEELEFEGVKLSIPADQKEKIEKALLRQADYSRKMNEVSAQASTYKQRIEHAEKLVEGAVKYAGALAEVQTLDARIKQFDALDWQTLRRDNPAEYAAYAADLQSLRTDRAAAINKSQAVGKEVEDAKFQTFVQQRSEMTAALAKDLKGWGDEMGTAITRYATESGIRRETLDQLTDPAVVIALHKAKQFDALQAAKVEIKAKAKAAPPVLKPGAPRQSNPQTDALARLRKSNSVDDAAAAFMSKMR